MAKHGLQAIFADCAWMMYPRTGTGMIVYNILNPHIIY